MCRKSVDFWVELPSPLKNSFKAAFFDFAKRVYDEKGLVLSSYFPVQMGGDMKDEDYLLNMEHSRIPKNYFCMGFGEISDTRFFEKNIRSGLFSYKKIVGWFPEAIVVDKKRLGNRPVPKNYFDLEKTCYKNEICIIGTPEIPDPLVSLFIYRKRGENSMRHFIENLAGFGAPVNAIRHIGKSSNKFGSIFIMPLLFANVCREIKDTEILVSDTGIFAEPFVLLSQNIEDEKSRLILEFLNSEELKHVFTEKDFLISDYESDKLIDPLCKDFCFLELEKVYKDLRKNFSKKNGEVQ